MRKSLFVVAAGVVALATAAIALAAAVDPSFKQHLEVKFTAHKAKTATGVKARSFTTYAPGTEPGNPKRIVIDVGRGVKFDTSVRPICKASNAQIHNSAGAVCRKSRIATGVAKAELNGVPVEPDSEVQVFNLKRGLFLHIFRGQAEVFLRTKLSGSRIVANVPPLPFGAKLTSLELTIKRLTKTVTVRRGKKRIRRTKAFLITPSKCVGGKFVSKASYTHSDAAPQSATSESPCT